MCKVPDRATEVAHHLEKELSVETLSTSYKSAACTDILTGGMERVLCRKEWCHIKGRDLIFDARNSIIKFADVPDHSDSLLFME